MNKAFLEAGGAEKQKKIENHFNGVVGILCFDVKSRSKQKKHIKQSE